MAVQGKCHPHPVQVSNRRQMLGCMHQRGEILLIRYVQTHISWNGVAELATSLVSPHLRNDGAVLTAIGETDRALSAIQFSQNV